ncbi:hypothetical protein SAMN05421738_1082 [Algoriella xinjiangensis]|uniref:C1q domain-containing protein n=1 Tax=Algoriella xinjiangensis TaxID=684065 RepID=A0A1I4X1D7_9FLAO|nr:hypothetical protein [Algoriella xinjiangensis]SFN19186.1 hypothetical protein SAMN05421738_1082 [Algoriella xinjiangensis]VDH14656.1 Uncharacterised protein [Algoriella xinjiangensis]
MNCKTSFLIILISCKVYCQVGINTKNPRATLEVVSNSNTSSSKNLEINNANNNQIIAVYDNGNFEFNGALIPNSSAGKTGEYLFSKGANNAPVWKSILPENSKQLYDIFNVQQYNDNGNYTAKTWNKIRIQQIMIPLDPTMGSWSNNEFTVSKEGIYYISVALEMSSGTILNTDQSKLRIKTNNKTTQINSATTQSGASNPTVYFENSNAEITLLLKKGDKIWFEAYSPASWKLGSAVFHLRFAESI